MLFLNPENSEVNQDNFLILYCFLFYEYEWYRPPTKVIWEQ